MFYVYNSRGLQFRGPMESLEMQKKVEKSQPLDEHSFGDQLTFISESGSGTPRTNAVAAYQKAIHRENMVEPLVHIYQIMSSPVITISPALSLLAAWEKTREEKIKQLVVINDKKDVLGVLSDRDILRHLIIDGESIHIERDLVASEVIEEDVITTDSMSDIRRVARVLALYHLDAMPVLQNDNLVGIVTRGDILRGFAENPKLNLWG